MEWGKSDLRGLALKRKPGSHSHLKSSVASWHYHSPFYLMLSWLSTILNVKPLLLILFFFLTVGVFTHIGNIGHTCLLQIKHKGQWNDRFWSCKRAYTSFCLTFYKHFPGGSDGKASAYNAGDLGSILGSERSGEGNGNPLQYSCLENPIDGGA